MNKENLSPIELIHRRFGTNLAIAKLLNMSAPQVCNWVKRGAIPLKSAIALSKKSRGMLSVSDLCPKIREPFLSIAIHIGDTTLLSKKLGVMRKTINGWKARGAIPERHHSTIIRLSGGKITAEQLK